MREETEELKISNKNVLNRKQYGKKLKEIQVFVENKVRKEMHTEMMRRYWDKRKSKMRKEK